MASIALLAQKSFSRNGIIIYRAACTNTHMRLNPVHELSKQSALLNTSVTRVAKPNFVKLYCSNTTSIAIVSYEDIKQLPKHPEKLLVDVREPKELEETGNIPTSINIPLGQVAAELALNVDAGSFKAKYGREKPQKNTEIIFHCKIGRRSQSAAEIAQSLGYNNIKNYVGSWTEWAKKEGLPK